MSYLLISISSCLCRLWLVLGLSATWLLPSPSLAETPDSSLTGARREQALKWLFSTETDTRRMAHQALSQLGDQDAEIHEELLVEARAHHAKAFEDLLKNAYQSSREFSERFRDWRGVCEKALVLARRELVDDASAQRQLLRDRDAAARAYKGLAKSAPAAERTLGACEALAKIVLELEMEIAVLKDEEDKAYSLDLSEIIERAPYGEKMLELGRELRFFRELHDGQKRVENHNQKAALWPDDSQRDFAGILNGHRVHLGLAPLYLQKELCQASFNHSMEMRRLGYFSHTSPTPSNRSMDMRAQHVRYPGQVQGENIYMGSQSPQAAFNAWWESDGHRKILLADGPNHLGIGTDRAYWTMNVGRGAPPTSAEADD